MPASTSRLLVLAACRVIHGSGHAPLCLDEVARAVGCSKYHLCREFKRLLGVTIHRYQLRLRLGEALSRLSAETGSLTALALDLGFSSHSHFTAAFRREFGLVPSDVRSGAQDDFSKARAAK